MMFRWEPNNKIIPIYIRESNSAFNTVLSLLLTGTVESLFTPLPWYFFEMGETLEAIDKFFSVFAFFHFLKKRHLSVLTVFIIGSTLFRLFMGFFQYSL